MVDDHSRLGEREPGEHADGVQRDEVGDVTAEHDDECSGQGGEHEDPVGEDEPVAAVGELAGEEAVAGDDPGQAWKVGVGGVGGEDQDGEGGEWRRKYMKVSPPNTARAMIRARFRRPLGVRA